MLRLQEIMNDLGITQVSLSKETGISRTTLHRIINKGGSVTNHDLIKIAKVLDVDVRELFKPTKITKEKYYTDDETGDKIKITEL